MTFSFSAEQDELRASVRKFLGQRSPSEAVRAQIDSAAGYDDDVWCQMAGQMGLASLAIPEEYGGSGFGPAELGIVLEEAGRALLCSPYFATVALAGQALTGCGDEAAKRRWLPAIASGELTATLAVAEESGSWDLDSTATRARSAGDGWVLEGTKMFVVDGHTADLILVIARSPQGFGLFAIPGQAENLTRHRLDALDLTRRLAQLEFAGTPAVLASGPADATEALYRVLDLVYAATSVEQVGGAHRCLDMAVDYAKLRVQFGRPIGSFQAIKHKCADMLIEVESARSAAYYAIGVAADGPAGELPSAAALAKAYCSEAYTHAAKENIQVHGGIGFTWEHDAHLYLRRAKSSELLFGAPAQHRERLATLVAIKAEGLVTMTAHTEQAVPGRQASDEEFRLRLREFLTGIVQRLGKPPRGERERLEWERSWAATLFDHGYAGPSWPRAYGGMELGFARQVIYQEEAAKARVPSVPGTGTGIAAPTIIAYGSAEQKERFLRPMLRADQIWAQGYSEPEAGSDLPSLRTTARRDGEQYVVNGQKVWTSSGHLADILFTLVRTGPPESRQDGITYLLIDAHSPGVTVRPLRDLTGGHKFSEIYFDDVRVPACNRIGEENGGWPLVRTSLGHERAASALNQAAMYRRVLDDLIALAAERGLNTQPTVRDALARFETRVRIMRYIAMRTISDIMSRGEPGPASSVSRLVVTSFEQDLHEFAVDLLGSHGLLTGRDAHAVQRGRWLGGFLATRASTIGAGTAEIQRNTIAEKVLGLPYDPAMPAATATKGST